MFTTNESSNSLQFSNRTAFIAGLIAGALLLCTVGFIVLAVLIFRGQGLPSLSLGAVDKPTAQLPSPTGTPSAAPTEPSTADIRKVKIDNAPFIGQQNAPVTMAYWRDFQCPFCQQFEVSTLPKIIDQYVTTGKLKIVFKDFAFLSEDSDTAAIMARAVWELAPDRQFAWLTAVFKAQGQERSGWANKENLLKITKTVPGIDADRVSQLMISKQSQYQQLIDQDKAEGAQMGINGTPGFVIGTQIIAGAEPLANFQSLLDAELAKK